MTDGGRIELSLVATYFRKSDNLQDRRSRFIINSSDLSDLRLGTALFIWHGAHPYDSGAWGLQIRLRAQAAHASTVFEW